MDLNEEHKTISVLVPERMLSLAIGKEGQNARLAAKLTGWRINIKLRSQRASKRLTMMSWHVERLNCWGEARK